MALAGLSGGDLDGLYGSDSARSDNGSELPPEVARDLRIPEPRQVISSYHAEVFDMSDDARRKEYESTMLKLSKSVMSGTCSVWTRSREKYTRADGSVSWMILVEWSDYVMEGSDVSGKKN